MTLQGWSLVAIPPPQVAILHREREVGRLLDLLAARTARVVLVVGESGSGRSAVLAALAAVSLEPPVVPVGNLGAPSPGALLQMIHRRAPAACPVALEGAAWLGPEGSDGVVQLLATAATGRRWIMTMSPADLRRLEIATPDFANQCETLVLTDPEPTVALDMVEAGLDGIAATGAVDFAPEVASPLLRLSARYPSERAQPGRALAIAELAAARAVRLGQREVGPAAIAAVIADAAGVPAQQLLRNDDDRFRSLEEDWLTGLSDMAPPGQALPLLCAEATPVSGVIVLWPRFCCSARPGWARPKPRVLLRRPCSMGSPPWCASTCPSTASLMRWPA